MQSALGLHAKAVRSTEAAVTLLRRIGRHRCAALVELLDLVEVFMRSGEIERVAGAIHSAFSALHGLGDAAALATGYQVAAALMSERGRHLEAATMLRKALELCPESEADESVPAGGGASPSSADVRLGVLLQLAQIKLETEQLAEGVKYAGEAQRCAHKAGDKASEIRALGLMMMACINLCYSDLEAYGGTTPDGPGFQELLENPEFREHLEQAERAVLTARAVVEAEEKRSPSSVPSGAAATVAFHLAELRLITGPKEEARRLAEEALLRCQDLGVIILMRLLSIIPL